MNERFPITVLCWPPDDHVYKRTVWMYPDDVLQMNDKHGIFLAMGIDIENKFKGKSIAK